MSYKDMLSSMMQDNSSETRSNIKSKSNNGQLQLSTESSNITNLRLDSGFIRGDLDGDGEVSIVDVSKLNGYVGGYGTLTDAELSNADINEDGYIDKRDVEALSRILVELPVDDSGTSHTIGDANGDGKIDSADV